MRTRISSESGDRRSAPVRGTKDCDEDATKAAAVEEEKEDDEEDGPARRGRLAGGASHSRAARGCLGGILGCVTSLCAGLPTSADPPLEFSLLGC